MWKIRRKGHESTNRIKEKKGVRDEDTIYFFNIHGSVYRSMIQ
jgi:hypothetical protein